MVLAVPVGLVGELEGRNRSPRAFVWRSRESFWVDGCALVASFRKIRNEPQRMAVLADTGRRLFPYGAFRDRRLSSENFRGDNRRKYRRNDPLHVNGGKPRKTTFDLCGIAGDSIASFPKNFHHLS